MKIGILTFHKAHNYGAIFQVYCLQEFLKAQGINTEIIDYNSFANNHYKLSNFFRNKSLLKLFVFTLFKFYRVYKRYRIFDIFINKHLNLSQKTISGVSDLYDISYDVIILGSDQIWNPRITNGYDPIYWGAFDTRSKILKISYAASMESKDIKDESRVKELLQSVDVIGVREESLKKLLAPITDKSINVVLDPTFLAGSAVRLSSLEKKPARIDEKKPFVFIYQVRPDELTFKVANKISSFKNLNIYEAASEVYLLEKKWQKSTYSIEEFIWLINHAEFVVTTSFHGTALSLIFEKEFISISGKGQHRSTRIESILKNIGLDNRFIDELEDVDSILDEPINYEKVTPILQSLSIESSSFITKALYNRS